MEVGIFIRGVVVANSNVIQITTDNFAAEIGTKTLVVVDFGTTYSIPCKFLDRIIDKVADKFAGKVKIGKVIIDENPDLAVKYNISSVPYILMFKRSDQPIFQYIGIINETALVRAIEENI